MRYIRHFAGIAAEYIPSYCGYAASEATYRPDFSRPVLFARNHNNPASVYSEAHRVAAKEARSRASRGARPGAGAGLQADRLRFVRTEDAYPSGFECVPPLLPSPPPPALSRLSEPSEARAHLAPPFGPPTKLPPAPTGRSCR